jgi:arylsulfatase A-like enzyme
MHPAAPALLAALALLAGCAAEPPARPNVLLVTLDTTRADRLGLYGYARPTSPNLDALAAESVVYEVAYSTSSWTLPAHASLFTGKYPKSHGASHDPEGPLVLAEAIDAPHAIRARSIAPSERTLASLLREAGYATGGVVAGPWMLGTFGLAAGFEAWDDAGILNAAGRRAADVTDGALAWLEDVHEPFLLFLNYFDPHFPYAPPAAWASSFLPPGVQPNPRSAAQASDLYDAEILYMDHEFGRLLRALHERGVYDRTLIVVTSDHGELLGERGEWGHERFLWEPLVRVPLVVRHPGGRGAGTRVRDPVSIVDIFSLILDAAGIEVPAGAQGEVPPARSRPLLAEVDPIADGPTGRWKARWEGRQKTLVNTLGERYVFDLAADPEEHENLADRDPARAERAVRALEQAFQALPPAAEAGEGFTIDDATREALRALGYLGTHTDPEEDEEAAAGAPR